MNLVWLRNDLRIADNPALHHACAAGATACLYSVTPQQWRDHDEAPCKIGFMLENLQLLAGQLAELNIPLKIIQAETFADLPQLICDACQEWDVETLWFNDDVLLNEIRRDQAVCEALAETGVAVERCAADLIHQPGTVLTQAGEVYRVFTPFYRRWISLLPDVSIDPLATPVAQSQPPLDSDSIPDQLSGWDLDFRADLWPAGETSAHKRLRKFVARRHQQYATDRDFPNVPGTSQLSPYLAVGVISVRQCIKALRQVPHDEGWERSKWLSELVWREFYRHLVAARPDLCRGHNFRDTKGTIAWQENDAHWQAWCEGQTGFPLVDAAMRQLKQTGWMHNRLRMVTASFLTKLLMIDWRKGEHFFMQHLIDGDFASNNGGWQWASSTGADAAPYFRIFNPTTQSQRYDQKGDFIRRFVPELQDLDARDIHDPDNSIRRDVGYPEPVIDYKAARESALSRYKDAFD